MPWTDDIVNVSMNEWMFLADMNLTTREPGTPGGLTVALLVNQNDYLYASSPSAGFRVSLTSLTSTYVD